MRRMKNLIAFGVAMLMIFSLGITCFAEPTETTKATESSIFTVDIQPDDMLYHNKQVPNVALTVTGPNGTDL